MYCADAVYALIALLIGVSNDSVYCTCNVTLLVHCQCTLSVLPEVHCALTVYTTGSQWPCASTDSVNYMCSVRCAHPMWKSSECALTLMAQIVQLTHLVRMNSALLVKYLCHQDIAVGKKCCKTQFLHTAMCCWRKKITWHIAVPTLRIEAISGTEMCHFSHLLFW